MLNKRKILNQTLVFCMSVIALVLDIPIVGATDKFVKWTCSTETDKWVDKGRITTTIAGYNDLPYIDVDPKKIYQQIDGWGGCFNELGWDALSVLDRTNRESVIKALFDPKTGCKFNICRAPIGASDFAMSYYSLNDTPGDYAMTNFNISRDKQNLIPYIKAAIRYRPDLKIWASPWTPPSWMKTNKTYAGGKITWTDQNLKAYALYLEKYVQAYRKEAINIYAIHYQNEPYSEQVFPSCLWSINNLKDFVRNYLGPKFKADQLHCEIWLGTLNNGDQFTEWGADVLLKDKVANSFITGVGYQWGGKDDIAECVKAYPYKKYMQTETECGGGENNWGYAENNWDLMRFYLSNSVNSYMQWNMILDQTGNSSWGWKQCAMVVVDKTTKSVTYNPQYYQVKHFSYYIKPGAVRISTSGIYTEAIAFKNPDGEIVVEVKNGSNSNLTVAINIGGNKITPVIPAHSFNTFVVK